ncbi:uncharacterized protein V1510DRAFT_322799 [Dipodascopsis tothii]|uniref:uncharacterized protein n=1 Tax=Dipodascopsis tothii TaxID=44089 RepID=UPI0034CE7B4F
MSTRYCRKSSSMPHVTGGSSSDPAVSAGHRGAPTCQQPRVNVAGVFDVLLDELGELDVSNRRQSRTWALDSLRRRHSRKKSTKDGRAAALPLEPVVIVPWIVQSRPRRRRRWMESLGVGQGVRRRDRADLEVRIASFDASRRPRHRISHRPRPRIRSIERAPGPARARPDEPDKTSDVAVRVGAAARHRPGRRPGRAVREPGRRGDGDGGDDGAGGRAGAAGGARGDRGGDTAAAAGRRYVDTGPI